MPLPRPCKKCEERFQPSGKRTTLCSKCLRLTKNVNFIKLIAHRNGLDLEKLNQNW